MITRESVVPALVAEWSAIDELMTTLEPEHWEVPTTLPGWSVRDNITHIIGTECALGGRTPPPSDVDVAAFAHVRNEIGVMNERWIESMRGERPEVVVERFREITSVRRTALESLSQAEFDAPSWTPAGAGTYGRFMRIRVFDCWMHEQDVRDAVGVPGHESGRCAEVALAEVGAALGYIVGKKAGAPDGGTVTVDLTGPQRITWHVAVDGRAAVVDDLPRAADATVRMPSPVFRRLVGGRAPVADLLGEIDVDGDDDLGQRVVRALPFTI